MDPQPPPPSRDPPSPLTQLGPPGVGTPAAAAGLDTEKPFRSHPVCDVPARKALPALEVRGGGPRDVPEAGRWRLQVADWGGLGWSGHVPG